MNLTKFIPSSIKIKSLYWTRKGKEIDEDLKELFDLIDNDSYKSAKSLLEHLRLKWGEYESNYPFWFHKEYLVQFVKAETMLYFLTSDEE